MKIIFPLKIPFMSKIRFQNANSPLIEQLVFFHDHIITILILIISIVRYNLFKTVTNMNINSMILESQSLELFWTVAPTFILLLIGFPSIRILYLLDEVFTPSITLKTLGHQWYWRYEYSDFVDKEFDSFITTNTARDAPQYRLIDVDSRVTAPFKLQIRNLIRSSDVLHSWAVPRLGLKVDAVPGRLNQLRFIINKPGLFYGQCSEICGANHRFMPICIESVSHKEFIKWVTSS